MANPGCAELLRPPARIIHLRVGVPAALERLALSRDPRPLLAVADPAAALRELSGRRASAYARADAELDTEVLDLQQLVGEVARLASAAGAG
jgi:shikimate kinase